VLLSAGTSIYALIESRSEDSLKTTADRSCGALTQFCVDDTQAWGETRGRAQVARWAAVALASGTLAVWMVTCVF
jgi:hypothetical protein